MNAYYKGDRKMYVVETFTEMDGWVNTWTVDGVPETFKTVDQALKALDSFFEDVREDYEAGYLDDPYDRADYRVKFKGDRA